MISWNWLKNLTQAQHSLPILIWPCEPTSNSNMENTPENVSMLHFDYSLSVLRNIFPCVNISDRMHAHFLTNYMLKIRFLLFPCAIGLLLLLLSRLYVVPHSQFVVISVLNIHAWVREVEHDVIPAAETFHWVEFVRIWPTNGWVCGTVSEQLESRAWCCMKRASEIYSEQIMEV